MVNDICLDQLENKDTVKEKEKVGRIPLKLHFSSFFDNVFHVFYCTEPHTVCW